MNLAAWRFPVSIRHDVLIPVAVVLGLWGTAAWYYSANTYAGGAVSTPDQAIAAMKRICGARADPALLRYKIRAWLNGDTWFVKSDLRDYVWQHTDGNFSAIIDARTGKVRSCYVGASN